MINSHHLWLSLQPSPNIEFQELIKWLKKFLFLQFFYTVIDNL